MWKAFKAMPALSKVLIILLTMGVAYKLTHFYHGPHRGYQSSSFGEGSGYEGGNLGHRLDEADENDSSTSDQKGRMVAQFEAQRMQITRQVQQCLNDTQRYQQAAAMAAMNGQMVPPPQC